MAQILVSSLVSNRDSTPRIDVTLNGNRVQLSAMEARELVKHISEAIVAAESDAFIFAFIVKELGQSPATAGQLLISFRDFRDELEKQWKNSREIKS